MKRLGFSARQRVKKQRDFDRVYRHKAYAADSVLVLNGCRNGLSHSRLGLAVSRKVGNAVQRNRWKRRIREAFRLSQEDLPAGFDFVARPRRGAVCETQAIRRSLPRLTRQLEQRIARHESRS